MPRIDDTAKQQRLDRIHLLLARNARGVTEAEIADEINLERRTVNNYLRELEFQGKAFKDGLYWFPLVLKESRLRSFDLSPEEAVTLYLGARLLVKQQDKRNEPAETALLKLASVLKADAGVGDEIEQAARELAQRPVQENYQPIFRDVMRGYIYRKKVEIAYRPLNWNKSFQTTFSTYLLEPSPIGFTTYLIGHSSSPNALRAYKLERIESIRLTKDDYSIPPDFPGLEILRNAWSIVMGAETIRVVLRFTSGTAKARVLETRWHPSQQTQPDPDDPNALLWEVQVADTLDLVPWIRSWGADCEVVEPKELREALVKETKLLARVYGMEKSKEQDPMVSKLLRLWGKTERNSPDPEAFHPALFHMLDVGNVARELLSEKASKRWRKVMADALGADADTVADWLPWLVALHDVGKISAAFQQANDTQRQRLEKEGFTFGNRQWNNTPYHALISSVFAGNKEDKINLPDSLRQGWTDALAGHHGEFSGREARRDARHLLQAEPPEWTELRYKACETMKEALLSLPSDSWPSPSNLSASIMALTGFIILCDWIGSDEEFFQPAPNNTWQEYGTKSVTRAAKAVESAGFFQPAMSIAPTSFAALFSGLTPRPLQLAIDTISDNILGSPCLAIIESPTGEGKTEAALALAHRLAQTSGSDELYYALPTTATSNQMFARLRKHVEERLALSNRVGLVHGQAFLLDDNFLVTPLQNGRERNSSPDWFGSDKRKSLLMPFGVGTIDQAELAALNVRFTVLRLIGLAGKVVILDEVHAYDTYMTTIIERLLNWLSALGTSVILLSATLPTSRREALIRAYGAGNENADVNPMAYPKLCVISRAGIHATSPLASQPERKITIGALQLDDDESEIKAQLLLNSISDGGCVCWITNTVDRAQKIFEQVNRLASPDVERMLLHARFPLDDRQKLEAELITKYGPEGKRPSKGIVIGTQVLEQSLDLDFDMMVSDLAPIDFLLQRVGRLHRHAHHTRPTSHIEPRLWINLPKSDNENLSLGADALIYDEFILRQTLLALNGKNELHLPADYRPLVETVYDDSEPAMNSPMREAWKKLQQKQEKARGEARWRVLPEPDSESSFAGQLAGLTFEENESKANWLVAQTRLGEESLTIIPLERNGNSARLWPADETVSLDIEASRETQKKLMRRNIRTGHRELIEALKAGEKNRPRLFTESSLLKECYPLWLENGAASISVQKGKLLINLHSQLGLIIKKEKEASE
ncbi:MAG: CRISPR-associated helicase Cas3' [Chloroflexi bacterium]|nr:CRISPR-associated helicase Cas3' [Chloroflexota bacterium]